MAVLPSDAKVILNTNLTSDQKMVFIALLYCRNTRTEMCFPQIKTISALTGIKIRTLHRVIKSLTDMRLLSKVHHEGRTHYAFVMDELERKCPLVDNDLSFVDEL